MGHDASSERYRPPPGAVTSTIGRLSASVARDVRFLALSRIALSDRLRLTYEKYASRERAALGLPLKATITFSRRPYCLSTPTDAALLQRVLMDTHECLKLFGLLGEAGLTVVDVGAHNGETAIAWSTFLRDPAIYSFEPDPVAAGNAERNVGGFARAVHAVGLSDHAGEAPFEMDGGSGGDATFVLAEEGSTAVPVARGDDILAGICPDLIKIDVEGYERHVVEGLRETLGRCRFLTIEMSMQRPKDHRFHEIAAVLSAHRFELVGTSEPHGADASRPTAIDLHFHSTGDAPPPKP